MGKEKISAMRVVKQTNNNGPLSEDGFILRSARFIGRAAWRIQQVITNKWFLIMVSVATLYFLMRLAGVSIEVLREGSTLITIR